MLFTLSSPTITAGAEIPVEHTCDAGDTAPNLGWAGTPGGTSELLLLMDDPDAGGFIHWLVTAIPADATQLGPGPLPTGARQMQNDFGRMGYGGPCPPSGTHRYDFTLYALSGPVNLPATPSSAQVRQAVRGLTLGTAELHARYTRRR
jgi:Raf kinase inhibitor-like YbhB/YbcL family protein